MEKYYKRTTQALTALLLLVLSVTSCKKFVDIDLPPKSLLAPYVLESNSSLVSALNGVYAGVASASMDAYVKPALFADELASSTDLISTQNTYTPTDVSPYSFFANYYRVIYDANYLLEGLVIPPSGLSPDTVKQVQGECYFLRAFSNFQLTNYYGTPPLVLTTDFHVAAYAPNASVDTLYGSIISDLKNAVALLPDSYPDASGALVKRVRVNKQAANALLAKAYLYRKDWADAITAAGNVIAANSLYQLSAGINTIFTPTSTETIWQLWNTTGVTPVGPLLIPSSATVIPSTTVRNEALNAFDTVNDLRFKSWMGSQTVGGTKYYYAYKYKLRATGGAGEYLVQLRLAELLLTRAEALAQSNKVPDALADLSVIRNRAGLTTPLSPTISQSDLLDSIAVERRRELIFESGNRWFDLKRTGNAVEVLSPIKPGFQAYKLLLPYNESNTGVIPLDPNITQNPGYDN